MKRYLLVSAAFAAACGGAQSAGPVPPATTATGPAASAQAPAGPDYAKLPKPAAAPNWTLEAAKTWKLENGMKVYYLRQGSTPLVSLLLVLPRGAATDPKGKEGLTALTTDMLDEGAGGKTALELSEELQRLGTDYYGSTDVDGVTLGMNLLAENFGPSAKLLSDIVRRPALSPKELVRRRDQRVAEELSQQSEPGHGRAIVLRHALFGEGYGSWLPTGTEGSLKKLSLADVKRQYLATFVPDGAALVVVGGIEEAPVKQALAESFGDWSGKATSTEAAVSDAPVKNGVYFVDYKGTTQSAIAFAHRAGAETSPEYFPAKVFSRAFGEAFTSRVNLNLREDKGYTYGARSAFSRWTKTGFFAIAANVKRETTRASIDEVVKELNGICGPRPLSQTERDDAVNGLLLGFPGRFEQNGDVAAQLSMLPVYGRPNDWYSRWPGNVRSVTAEAANAVAKSYCDAKDYVVVVAGDRSVVEPTLAGLEMPLQFFDAKGKLVK
ncbi:MAG: insulinase family protein [Myxococcales bacterium]|nr:insulinase family protein [Myxococcales bacterium]